MSIIAVDVDQVVANTFPVWQEISKRVLGYTYAMEKIYSKEAADDKDFLRLLNDSTLYQAVFPIDDAQKGVHILREEGHRCVFVTSCTMGMRDAKVEWLMRWGFLPRTNLQQEDFIDVHDKSLVHVDVAIDDLPKNLKHYGKRAVLFDAPYNRQASGLFTRVVGWREVPAILSLLDQRYVTSRR